MQKYDQMIENIDSNLSKMYYSTLSQSSFMICESTLPVFFNIDKYVEDESPAFEESVFHDIWMNMLPGSAFPPPECNLNGVRMNDQKLSLPKAKLFVKVL